MDVAVRTRTRNVVFIVYYKSIHTILFVYARLCTSQLTGDKSFTRSAAAITRDHSTRARAQKHNNTGRPTCALPLLTRSSCTHTARGINPVRVHRGRPVRYRYRTHARGFAPAMGRYSFIFRQTSFLQSFCESRNTILPVITNDLFFNF